MKGFLKNIHAVILNNQETEDKDRGDLVQMIIIVAGFAIAAIAIVGWITTALYGVGADTAKCVTNYGQGLIQNRDTACYSNYHAWRSDCAIRDDKAYQSRFDENDCWVNNGGGSVSV